MLLHIVQRNHHGVKKYGMVRTNTCRPEEDLHERCMYQSRSELLVQHMELIECMDIGWYPYVVRNPIVLASACY